MQVCGLVGSCYVMHRHSPPAAFACLSPLTCRLGARRQVPHDGLAEANSAYRCNEAHSPPPIQAFGCGQWGDAVGTPSQAHCNLSLRSLVTGETGFACVACFCLCYLSLIVLPFFRPQPSAFPASALTQTFRYQTSLPALTTTATNTNTKPST